jgi:hypothetical protein
MADLFTGLSYGDQLEVGLATHGAADPEVWNAMLRKDADEARLAQVWRRPRLVQQSDPHKHIEG